MVAVEGSSRPAELCGLGQPASRARGFGTLLFVFSTLVTAVLCTRGCSEPCIVLSLNIGGSGEALGLDNLSSLVLRPCSTRPPYRSKANLLRAPPLKRATRQTLFPRRKGPFCTQTSHTWLLHSTSRPWSTPWPRGRPSRTPLRPASALAPFNLRLSWCSLAVGRRTRGRRPAPPEFLGQRTPSTRK